MKPPEDTSTEKCGDMRKRMIVLLVLLLAGFVTIGWRLHQVQVVEHEKWAARSEGMLKLKRVLPSMRGAIRDSGGELLAHDKLVHDLWVSTLMMRDFNDVRARLARLQKRSVREVSKSMTREQILEEYRRHVAVVLASGMYGHEGNLGSRMVEMEKLLSGEKATEFALLKGLTEEDAKKWQSLLEENGMVAVSLRPTVKRFYPCAERLTHVLGYVNYNSATQQSGSAVSGIDAQVGREGVEAVMHKTLKGEDGFQWIERDRRGREITAFRGETKLPKHGHEVWLTIDMHLQDIVEEVLEEAVLRHSPKRIVAVIADPHTGAILAMANRPHFQRDTMEGTMLNLAVGAEYEPGSVFKIVGFTGAFDRKLTYMEESLNIDPNSPALKAAKLRDHVHGEVTTAEAFAQSSNRAAYLMARKLGEESFLDYTQRFGFGKKTGIGLTGEVSGLVQSRRNWDSLTFSRMAIGHAVTVTPLQMVMAVGAIANGGTLMKPQMVREVRDEDGKVVQQLQPEVVNRVCSEKAAAVMRRAMEEVVNSKKGTGKRAAVEGFAVAGKTGTSQRRRDDGRPGYEPGHYCVSFAGFAPADNPQLCAIIVVDDPKGDAEDLAGGRLAAPIFSQLMQQSLHAMAVAHRGPLSGRSLVKGDTDTP
ncbi:penicillin-binding protein 2 [Phragmitibacter flavus]|uniref:Penicillin-binding protein 2 n=1 Tax=Phragmitibacter flavus TaxID=2576071 RepID=A0A5R8K9L1_9BACT|nr:penicillin-binding protein 2 [Phragmitibacter flavus]TLD68994.1 penicillin-binding protein 2 [Phragmitibacter flavus]